MTDQKNKTAPPPTAESESRAQLDQEAFFRELTIRLFGAPREWDDYYAEKLNSNRKDFACGVCI